MTDLWPSMTAARINLAEEEDFDLGGMRVRPSELSVESNGKRVELQPRIMQVLVALAKARGAVVSRDRLIELCWEGRIVGDDAVNRCILALRHLAEQSTPPAFMLETVPRVGHRLIVPGQAEATRTARQAPTGLRYRLALLAVTLLVAVGGLLLWQQQRGQPKPLSIAVLPFTDLAGGDPYFAAGIGDEIFAQLAREPAFRLAGSASAARFQSGANPIEVGKALGVDYILEGGVRSSQGRVRVNASLIKSSDGLRLWSDSFDRELDDVLEIQAAISDAVSHRLERRLVNRVGPRAIDGEGYALYLHARGLLRSLNPEVGQDAVALLERAIRRDPDFAPAWASLAAALEVSARTGDSETMIAVLPRATAAARRALQLDPNLADAHGIYARLIGNESPRAAAHYRRASDLGGNTAEGLVWRGIASEVSGERERALGIYRRAHDLDPEWPQPLRALVDSYALAGDRPAAEALAESDIKDEQTRTFAMARIAWWSGDFSEAARHWAQLAKQPTARWASPSALSIEDTKLVLGLSTDLPSRPARPTVGSFRFGPRVWMRSAPSAAQWRQSNRSVAAALVHYDWNVVAAKLMLRAGRADELAATYDGPSGLLGIRRDEPIGSCQLDEAAIVALALRGAGRGEEAEAILRRANAVIEDSYRKGKVPAWFDEDAAGIWAVQGKAGPAAEALERALRRGWAHGGRTDLPAIADEPMFAAVRGDARVKAALAKVKAHYDRERAETARVLAGTA